jgi:hypothetical protein
MSKVVSILPFLEIDEEYVDIVRRTAAAANAMLPTILAGEAPVDSAEYHAWFFECCTTFGLNDAKEREFLRSYLMTILDALSCPDAHTSVALIDAAAQSAEAALRGGLQ